MIHHQMNGFQQNRQSFAMIDYSLNSLVCRTIAMVYRMIAMVYHMIGRGRHKIVMVLGSSVNLNSFVGVGCTMMIRHHVHCSHRLAVHFV